MRINSTWWLKFYAWLRGLTSPFIYRKFYRPYESLINLYKIRWDKLKEEDDIWKASEIINEQKYAPDKLGGLLDCSFPPHEPSYFFIPKERGRDCDEWARIWKVWGEANGYKAEEYIVTRLRIRGGIKWYAHMFTLLEKNGYWYLCDYNVKLTTTSRLKALAYQSSYSGGKHYQEYKGENIASLIKGIK